MKYKEIKYINDIECKLGEIYNDNHIELKNDNLYLSKTFAKYLLNKDFSGLNRYHNFYKTNLKIWYSGILITIYIKEIISSNGIRYSISGNSGDWGFGGLQRTKRETLGVRIKRKVNKYIINIYKDSPFIRFEKIKNIINSLEL